MTTAEENTWMRCGRCGVDFEVPLAVYHDRLRGGGFDSLHGCVGVTFHADDHDHPRGPSIRTVAGNYVDLVDPDPDTIALNDIAHALSQLNRFTGHTAVPYTVGEHSLNVAAMLFRQFGNGRLALLGLLHDASEAYLGDVSGPLKRTTAMGGYRNLETKMQTAILESFQLTPTPEEVEAVKACDRQILAWEMALFRDATWRTPTPPHVVREAFRERFNFYRAVRP